jgi:hypothetical protein
VRLNNKLRVSKAVVVRLTDAVADANAEEEKQQH